MLETHKQASTTVEVGFLAPLSKG